MKKTVLLASIFLGLIFTSCSKKDYTCNCVTANTTGSVSTSSSLVSASSEDDAKAECQSKNTVNITGGTVCDLEDEWLI